MIAGCVLLLTLTVAQVQACFGPKLFVARGQNPVEETLYALVTLYVEEKTGVESTLTIVDEGQNPIALLTGEKVDMVFAAAEGTGDDVVFQLGTLPVLVTGKRPIDDLQFTTVLPAVKKLEGLLTVDDVMPLIKKVEAGESAMAVARKFFMERRWI